MLESIFSGTAGDALTLVQMLTALGAALLLGLLISLVYLKTHREEGYSASFTVTLIMLPAIIAVIIAIIGNNVASAFSLAGAFSLIRFRSAPGDPKDIAYVFFTLAIGLACGMGYITYAGIFAIILCIVMIILNQTNFAKQKSNHMQLKITVPEDLNFQELFDDILEEFTHSWNLKRIKTSDFGSVFEVIYNINMKQQTDQKRFIDKLRCRNGNLNITLILKEYEDKMSA
ncbi:MAG: hypothetical protein K0S71_2972 [Clostridia bacterium]|jgi:uncharacterized membrane protein YhiD involved in acid resistance|nr:hypothetical protein [Clostridia bacterium]